MTKCEVRMTGYWPCVFKDHANNEQGQYPSCLIEQAWSIKEDLFKVPMSSKMCIFPSDATFHGMNICEKIFRFG